MQFLANPSVCVKAEHPCPSGLGKQRRAEETLYPRWPSSGGALSLSEMNHNTKLLACTQGIVILTQLHLTMHSFLTLWSGSDYVCVCVCVCVCAKVRGTLSTYWPVQFSSDELWDKYLWTLNRYVKKLWYTKTPLQKNMELHLLEAVYSAFSFCRRKTCDRWFWIYKSELLPLFLCGFFSSINRRLT